MYRRLTESDRIEIYVQLKAEKSCSWIARKLGFARSTISREKKRNSGRRGYRYKQAEKLACERQEGKWKSRISTET